MSNTVETWTCAECETTCSRPRTKGQRPRYCGAECRAAASAKRNAKEFTCLECGAPFHRAETHSPRYCSLSCSGLAQGRRNAALDAMTPSRPIHPANVQQMSPLRVAWEAEEWGTIKDLLMARTRTVGDCMEWGGAVDKDGYARVSVGRGPRSAYRVMASASVGRPLSAHEPVHHRCANRRCLNPEHLQVVTTHENTAEMLHRHAYLNRISDLEEVVRSLDPDHPILCKPL